MRSLNAWLDALVQNRNETGIVEYDRYRKPPFYYIYSYTSYIYIYQEVYTRYIPGSGTGTPHARAVPTVRYRL